MRNIRIRYMLNGEEGQVIVFRRTLASHVVVNLAAKGATQIEVIGKHYHLNVEADSIAIIEKFKAFISSK